MKKTKCVGRTVRCPAYIVKFTIARVSPSKHVHLVMAFLSANACGPRKDKLGCEKRQVSRWKKKCVGRTGLCVWSAKDKLGRKKTKWLWEQDTFTGHGSAHFKKLRPAQTFNFLLHLLELLFYLGWLLILGRSVKKKTCQGHHFKRSDILEQDQERKSISIPNLLPTEIK